MCYSSEPAELRGSGHNGCGLRGAYDEAGLSREYTPRHGHFLLKRELT